MQKASELSARSVWENDYIKLAEQVLVPNIVKSLLEWRNFEVVCLA